MVLEVAGVSINEIQALNLTFGETIEAFKDKAIDVAFITSGFPSKVVESIHGNNSAYLYDLQSDVLERLIEENPFFVVTNIPHGTYAHQNEEITTVGVSALLVARLIG